MADFCLQASTRFAIRLDRRVIDKTGVTGSFDFDLKWPEDLSPSPPDDFDRLDGALRHVGLQLTPSKGVGDFLIIDRAERPSAN